MSKESTHLPPSSFNKRQWGRYTALNLVIVTCLTLLSLSLSLAACTNLNSTTIPNPLDLVTPGVLTVASDTTNPPQEFIDPITQHFTGFDIDLITAIAQRLGLKVAILTTKVDLLISDLLNKRYDVAISAIAITPDRQAKAAFIPYFNAGESLLVQAGNPHHISSLADLCGQSVGVQADSREQFDLQNASQLCQQAGKPIINLAVLKNQFNVVQLLIDHHVIATFQNSAVTDYFSKLHPGRFAVGGRVINASSEGIAVNKDNGALFHAIQTTFSALKTDTTYHSIVMKWGVINEETMLVDRRTEPMTV